MRKWYEHNVKPYLGEHAQNLVEYAVLLAIVVGVGYLILDSGGLKESLQALYRAPSDLTYKIFKDNLPITGWYSSWWSQYR